VAAIRRLYYLRMRAGSDALCPQSAQRGRFAVGAGTGAAGVV